MGILDWYDATGRPRDYGRLITEANLRWAKDIADYYVGFVKFADPGSFPDVDVYAEKGSGVQTVVGARLANLLVNLTRPPQKCP